MLEIIKDVIEFCYRSQLKTDMLKEITESLFEVRTPNYEYGIGFADGLYEAYQTIGSYLTDKLYEFANEKDGDKTLN